MTAFYPVNQMQRSPEIVNDFGFPLQSIPRIDCTCYKPHIRPADLIPESKVKPVIALKFRVMEIVVAGCNDVTPPPAFDPALWIDFPARVIEHGVDGHNH